MGHRIGAPLDRVAEALEGVARSDRPVHADERVELSVGHEHRDFRVGGGALRSEGVGERKVGGEREHPGEAAGMAQGRLERDRPALREPREDDPVGGDAGPDLVLDERLDGALRRTQIVRIGDEGAAVVADVVPGPHRHAEVDGDRARRRVGEDEPGPFPNRAELGDDGREVVTVGAEAVEPDDGGGGGAVARLVDDGGSGHGVMS